MTYGVNSKNLKAVAECLDEYTEFIKLFGIDYTSEKEMKVIAKLADHSDKSIRENSLSALGELYKHLNEDIWRAIGQVSTKAQGLIEARLKKLGGPEEAPQ